MHCSRHGGQRRRGSALPAVMFTSIVLTGITLYSLSESKTAAESGLFRENYSRAVSSAEYGAELAVSELVSGVQKVKNADGETRVSDFVYGVGGENLYRTPSGVASADQRRIGLQMGDQEVRVKIRSAVLAHANNTAAETWLANPGKRTNDANFADTYEITASSRNVAAADGTSAQAELYPTAVVRTILRIESDSVSQAAEKLGTGHIEYPQLVQAVNLRISGEDHNLKKFYPRMESTRVKVIAGRTLSQGAEANAEFSKGEGGYWKGGRSVVNYSLDENIPVPYYPSTRSFGTDTAKRSMTTVAGKVASNLSPAIVYVVTVPNPNFNPNKTENKNNPRTLEQPKPAEQLAREYPYVVEFRQPDRYLLGGKQSNGQGYSVTLTNGAINQTNADDAKNSKFVINLSNFADITNIYLAIGQDNDNGASVSSAVTALLREKPNTGSGTKMSLYNDNHFVHNNKTNIFYTGSMDHGFKFDSGSTLSAGATLRPTKRRKSAFPFETPLKNASGNTISDGTTGRPMAKFYLVREDPTSPSKRSQILAMEATTSSPKYSGSDSFPANFKWTGAYVWKTFVYDGDGWDGTLRFEDPQGTVVYPREFTLDEVVGYRMGYDFQTAKGAYYQNRVIIKNSDPTKTDVDTIRNADGTVIPYGTAVTPVVKVTEGVTITDYLKGGAIPVPITDVDKTVAQYLDKVGNPTLPSEGIWVWQEQRSADGIVLTNAAGNPILEKVLLGNYHEADAKGAVQKDRTREKWGLHDFLVRNRETKTDSKDYAKDSNGKYIYMEPYEATVMIGMEDMPGSDADFDYNDVVLTVTIAPPMFVETGGETQTIVTSVKDYRQWWELHETEGLTGKEAALALTTNNATEADGTPIYSLEKNFQLLWDGFQNYGNWLMISPTVRSAILAELVFPVGMEGATETERNAYLNEHFAEFRDAIIAILARRVQTMTTATGDYSAFGTRVILTMSGEGKPSISYSQEPVGEVVYYTSNDIYYYLYAMYGDFTQNLASESGYKSFDAWLEENWYNAESELVADLKALGKTPHRIDARWHEEERLNAPASGKVATDNGDKVPNAYALAFDNISVRQFAAMLFNAAEDGVGRLYTQSVPALRVDPEGKQAVDPESGQSYEPSSALLEFLAGDMLQERSDSWLPKDGIVKMADVEVPFRTAFEGEDLFCALDGDTLADPEDVERVKTAAVDAPRQQDGTPIFARHISEKGAPTVDQLGNSLVNPEDRAVARCYLDYYNADSTDEIYSLWGLKDSRASIGFHRAGKGEGTTDDKAFDEAKALKANHLLDHDELVLLGLDRFNPYAITDSLPEFVRMNQVLDSDGNPVSGSFTQPQLLRGAIAGRAMPTFTFKHLIDGSGIMVVNGNLRIEDTFAYSGILVVLGDIEVVGSLNPYRVYYAKDGNPVSADPFYYDADGNAVTSDRFYDAGGARVAAGEVKLDGSVSYYDSEKNPLTRVTDAPLNRRTRSAAAVGAQTGYLADIDPRYLGPDHLYAYSCATTNAAGNEVLAYGRPKLIWEVYGMPGKEGVKGGMIMSRAVVDGKDTQIETGKALDRNLNLLYPEAGEGIATTYYYVNADGEKVASTPDSGLNLTVSQYYEAEFYRGRLVIQGKLASRGEIRTVASEYDLANNPASAMAGHFNLYHSTNVVEGLLGYYPFAPAKATRIFWTQDDSIPVRDVWADTLVSEK